MGQTQRVASRETVSKHVGLKITKDILNVSTNVSNEQVNQLLHILVNVYRDCFAFIVCEMGCTDLVEMNVEDNNIQNRKL